MSVDGLQAATVTHEFENQTNLGDIVRKRMCGKKGKAHKLKNIASKHDGGGAAYA